MKKSSLVGIWILASAVVVGVRADSKLKFQAQPGSTARAQQTAAPADPKKTGVSPSNPTGATAQNPEAMDEVLHSMDENASKFHTAQADFVWQIYNSVINDIAETDKGKIYFRRSGPNLQMSARFTDPPSKQVVFTGKAVQILQPGGQVDEYDTAAHQGELETFLVLGFGSSGKDLQKSFELQDLGEESIDGVLTHKLQLTPKAEDVRRHVPKIVLWMQPNGLSKQQQIYLEGGDYRTAKYASIQLNQNLSDNLFKLKGNLKKTVKH